MCVSAVGIHACVLCVFVNECANVQQNEFVTVKCNGSSGFGGKMARGYVTEKSKIDKTVWTQSFFAQVQSETDNCVGVHNLVWTVKWHGYSPGTLIMCARKMRTWLLDDQDFARYYANQHTQPLKLKCLRNALSAKSKLDDKECPSYLTQFKSLIIDPTNYAETNKLAFNDFMEWQQCFRILEPISDEKYVRSLLQRLRNSGLPLNDMTCDMLFVNGEGVESGKSPARARVYFYKCSCDRYRHYLWCLHVCLRAVHDKLVDAPYHPKTLDPTLVKSVKNKGGVVPAGRPAKARKGGALDSQG